MSTRRRLKKKRNEPSHGSQPDVGNPRLTTALFSSAKRMWKGAVAADRNPPTDILALRCVDALVYDKIAYTTP